MRKPSLSLETFVTALAVLGAASGCSRADKASAAPESALAPAPPPAAPDQAGAAATTAPALPAPAAQTDTPPPTATGAAPQAAAPPVVAKPADSSRKKADGTRRSSAPASDKPVNASCGAGTCTPDMKKGNGN